MSRAEQLFAALGDVGIDLIDMAQTRRFSKSPWRTVLGTAACAAVILSAALFLHRQPQVEPPAEVLPPPVIETVEEMLDARKLPGNLTLREIMLKIDKEDTVFGY